MTRRALVWLAMALLGIVATAALSWSASQVAGQRIGLAAEPLSVQRGLAPSSARGAESGERSHGNQGRGRAAEHPRSGQRRARVVTIPGVTTPSQTATVPVTTSAPTTTVTTSAPTVAAPVTTPPASPSPQTMTPMSIQPVPSHRQEGDDSGGQAGSSSHRDD